MLLDLFSYLFHHLLRYLFDSSLEELPMDGCLYNLFSILFHGGKCLIFGEAESGRECGNIIGSAVSSKSICPAGDDYIFEIGCPSDINYVGHACHPSCLLEDR